VTTKLAHASAATAFDARAAWRLMLLIRRFEERCLELSTRGEIAGSVHVCLGQEAIPAGAMQALTERDRVLATYRGHGWALACGVAPDRLLAEICQRATGVNGGRAGSPYLTAPDHGFLGENSIVGAGAPIATGVAMASIIKGDGRVALVSLGDGAMNQGATHEALVFAAARALPVFFGDGANNEGAFHEALNMAAIWKLPVIFVCENNGWSEMTPTASMFRVADIADRAAGYGISGRVVDGNDPEAVHAAVAQAADAARQGAGPVLLECKTARLSGHYNRDIEHYRPKDDAEAAAAGDPVPRLRTAILATGAADADLERVEAEVAHLVDDAADAATAAPAPVPGTDRQDVLATAPPSRGLVEPDSGGDELTYVKAVNAALDAELAGRPEVLVYGEDVGHAGGIFGASRGLQQRYGAERVFDTPIAESAILGSAVGAAMEGLRPVVEIMWADFLLVAFDQLANQAANVRYLSRSAVTAPLVVRTQQGVTPGSCAQHSQSLEALVAHVAGLKVGVPATAQDAYAMLRAAVADPDPCVLFESRALYQRKGPVALDGPAEAVGGARLHRRGTDVVVLTWGAMLHESVAASDRLREEGVSVAVLDLRWLVPLDVEAIGELVEQSAGRVLVAHEANLTGGFGAELSARINESHFDVLDAPVSRVGAPDVRMPSAPALQTALVPDAERIVEAARRLLGDTAVRLAV
jgi:2-oxoisovalerate dehydrogenase E1 component